MDCHKSLTWAERLKRVFNIDVSVCSRCGGAAERRPVKIIACIEDPLMIKKILDHLDAKSATPVDYLQKSRAPPRQGLLFTSE